MEEATLAPSFSTGLSLPALRALTRAGVLLYALGAGSDALLTAAGVGSDIELEGNLFLRRLMAVLGVKAALVLAKSATGLALWLLASRLGRAMHDAEPWIEKVPTLPPLRRWLRAGDRCWIALVPLYSVAASQACAACAWLWLKFSR